MIGRTLRVLLASSLVVGPAPLSAQAPSDPDVAKGIQQVEDGDYDAAIVTLDAAARRLAADPSHPRDLPQTYLYLGIAFVGKGHEAAAKARFRDALLQRRDLSLSADKFPPKVIDLFESARLELTREAREPATPVPVPSPTPASALIAPPKKGGSSKALLIVGVAAAAVGGVALAAKGAAARAAPPRPRAAPAPPPRSRTRSSSSAAAATMRLPSPVAARWTPASTGSRTGCCWACTS